MGLKSLDCWIFTLFLKWIFQYIFSLCFFCQVGLEPSAWNSVFCALWEHFSVKGFHMWPVIFRDRSFGFYTYVFKYDLLLCYIELMLHSCTLNMTKDCCHCTVYQALPYFWIVSHDTDFHGVFISIIFWLDHYFVMQVLFSGMLYGEIILQRQTSLLEDAYAIQALCVYQQVHILATVLFAL